MKRSMIIPILIYADKFAARQSIKHDQLFYMMLSRYLSPSFFFFFYFYFKVRFTFAFSSAYRK